MDLTATFGSYLADHGTPGQSAGEMVAAFAGLLASPETKPLVSPAEQFLTEALATP
ncbi:hypothetical protein [Streptomyces cinerochromogenes]|uniref:hypothetical protein n=1 Tax=Streptomyces cinerochromogenes TaxID=66422 RepID=UPI0033B2699A